MAAISRSLTIFSSFVALLGGLGVVSAPVTESAEQRLAAAYPIKPVQIVVAFAPAGSADQVSRLLATYLSKTFMGRAIRAVAQDEEGLRLMGANPVRIKQFAFGIATAVLGIAGALLIIVAPVEPTLDRVYIGRTFCVVVMAGLGSITGTLIAALILGVAESIVLTLFGASWAPAIAFAMLLGVLAVRPQGLLGR